MGSEGSGCYGGGAAAVLCDACGGAAAVYCSADAAALCAACDSDVHAANPLASRHTRIPLGGGGGGFLAGDEERSASSWLLHGCSSSSSSQNSNASQSGATQNSFVEFFSDMDAYPGLIGGDVGGGAHVSDGVVPAGAFWPEPPLCAAAQSVGIGAQISWPPPPPAAAAAAAEREARVRRYREKRKSRRFQKTIRYASRKAYAEARPRVKGRFVKRGASPEAAAAAAAGGGAVHADADDKFWFSLLPAPAGGGGGGNGGGFYIDSAYGVVPSF